LRTRSEYRCLDGWSCSRVLFAEAEGFAHVHFHWATCSSPVNLVVLRNTAVLEAADVIAAW
jgi:hypothetical protein